MSDWCENVCTGSTGIKKSNIEFEHQTEKQWKSCCTRKHMVWKGDFSMMRNGGISQKTPSEQWQTTGWHPIWRTSCEPRQFGSKILSWSFVSCSHMATSKLPLSCLKKSQKNKTISANSVKKNDIGKNISRFEIFHIKKNPMQKKTLETKLVSTLNSPNSTCCLFPWHAMRYLDATMLFKVLPVRAGCYEKGSINKMLAWQIKFDQKEKGCLFSEAEGIVSCRIQFKILLPNKAALGSTECLRDILLGYAFGATMVTEVPICACNVLMFVEWHQTACSERLIGMPGISYILTYCELPAYHCYPCHWC